MCNVCICRRNYETKVTHYTFKKLKLYKFLNKYEFTRNIPLAYYEK